MDSLVSRSISIILAVGIGYELARGGDHIFALGEQMQSNSASLHSRFVDKCCQVGRERAIESAKFNCKLTTREVLASLGQAGSDRASQLLSLSAESLVAREPNFADQCEMVLESCCLAHHRTRNCNSGKQFAKSGSACMDVELSKEATVATESFNDCCMSCSLGILAARTPAQNDSSSPALSRSSTSSTRSAPGTLHDRCRLISPLASTMSGQLYEQTYVECCQENLPRPSSALVFDSNAPIDCSQVANVCSQRCLPSGAPDPITRQPIEQDRCDCFTGYKLGPDGVSCVDIDECKQNLHTCNRQAEVCDNTRGSFRCLARAQQHQQHHQATRLLSNFDEHSSADPAAAAALALTGEQPFASLRLCPPGSRWLAAQNRCQPANGDGQHQHQHQQHHWKRNAAYSSSSSSSLSSSRRASATRAD